MKAPATRFEDLVVWQKAHQFVLATYRLPRTFPKSEPMVCPLNGGGRPSPLLRTLRKDSRNAERQTNSAFITLHKVPSKNLDTI